MPAFAVVQASPARVLRHRNPGYRLFITWAHFGWLAVQFGAVELLGIAGFKRLYDFGISLPGSTKGRGATVASRSPSGVATLKRVPSSADAVGTIA